MILIGVSYEFEKYCIDPWTGEHRIGRDSGCTAPGGIAGSTGKGTPFFGRPLKYSATSDYAASGSRIAPEYG